MNNRLAIPEEKGASLWMRCTGVGALFLIPLVPLAVYLEFLFPYTSGRNFFFRTLALSALSCWFLLWIHKPERYRPHSSFLVWAVLAFVAVVGVATVLAPEPSLAFWSTLERMDGFVSVLFLVAFFFSALHLFTPRLWRIFFHISLGTALVVSCVALLQLLGILEIHQGGVRIDATFGNASFFAAYMLLSAGLALFFAASAQARLRLAYVSCAALFLFLSLASATRSAFAALPIALFVSGITALFSSKSKTTPSPLGNPRGISPLIKGERQRGSVPPIGALRRFGIAALAGLALFASLFFALRQIPSLAAHPLAGRLLSLSLSGEDAQARFLSWSIALQGARERPLFGWGPEGFRAVFVKYYDPHLYGREQWFDRAHNTYLDWLVAAGGIGLLAYLLLWVGLARAVWGRRIVVFSAWEKVALSGMFAGYAAFNIFSFDTITASILFFSFLAYSTARSETHFQEVSLSAVREANRATRGLLQNVFRGVLIVFVMFVVLSTFYFAIAKPAYAAYLINEGLQNESPNVDTRLAFFSRAITLNTFATAEAREFLAQFAADVEPSLARDESRTKVLSLVKEELARQIAASPEDLRYPLRLGVVLNVYGRYEEAVPYLEQAFALSPNKQPTLYELGTSFLNLGRMNEAVEVFQRAADLLPDSQDLESKKLYAVALVYARRFNDAETYMRHIFNEPVFIDYRLADAYRRAGNRSKADILYAELVALEEAERLERRK